MAPIAHVIVYYVRTDGEVLADSLDVELTGVLQNHVSYYLKYLLKSCIIH